jgi:hypothetical protein
MPRAAVRMSTPHAGQRRRDLRAGELLLEREQPALALDEPGLATERPERVRHLDADPRPRRRSGRGRERAVRRRSKSSAGTLPSSSCRSARRCATAWSGRASPPTAPRAPHSPSTRRYDMDGRHVGMDDRSIHGQPRPHAVPPTGPRQPGGWSRSRNAVRRPGHAVLHSLRSGRVGAGARDARSGRQAAAGANERAAVASRAKQQCSGGSSGCRLQAEAATRRLSSFCRSPGMTPTGQRVQGACSARIRR